MNNIIYIIGGISLIVVIIVLSILYFVFYYNNGSDESDVTSEFPLVGAGYLYGGAPTTGTCVDYSKCNMILNATNPIIYKEIKTKDNPIRIVSTNGAYQVYTINDTKQDISDCTRIIKVECLQATDKEIIGPNTSFFLVSENKILNKKYSFKFTRLNNSDKAINEKAQIEKERNHLPKK
jgi:hypothetical protein